MKKPNPILILCNDASSGGEFYTNHLSSLNAGKSRDDADWVWVYSVRSMVTLDAILSSESGTDFDGYILPEFKDNPERFSILDEIQSHKKSICPTLARDFHVKTYAKQRKFLKLTSADRKQEEEKDIMDQFFQQLTSSP